MVAVSRFYQRAKNGVHAIQALVIFIAACITIAMFTKGGNSDGRIDYYFALCFISIPALVYQTAVPVFPRTRRFSHAYAHAILDIIFLVLWFAAFIGEAVWVKDGSHSAKDWKKKDHLCDVFNENYGSVSKCKLGQGAIILGVILWLLFGLSTAFSIYGVSFYRQNGHLPGPSEKVSEPLQTSEGQEDDYNFSAIPHDRLGTTPGRHEMPSHGRDEDEMSSLHTDPERDSGPNTNRPLSWQRQPTPELPNDPSFEPVDTSYHGGGQAYDPISHPSPPSRYQPRVPSPYNNEFTMHSNESHFVGGRDPRRGPDAGDPFSDDLALSHDHGGYGGGGHVGFPEGNYHR